MISMSLTPSSNANLAQDNETSTISSRTTTYGWQKIESHLRRLYDLSEPLDNWFTPDIFMNLYTWAYESCTNKQSGPIDGSPPASDPNYNSIQGRELYLSFCSFYEELMSKLCTQLISLPEVQIIEGYLTLWERFERVAVQIEAIFQYLDRYWIAKENEERRFTLHVYPLLWKWWDQLILLADGAKVESILLCFIKQNLCTERQLIQSGESMLIETNTQAKAIIRSFDAISCLPKGSHLLKVVKRVKLASNPLAERLLSWYCAELAFSAQTLLSETYPALPLEERPILLLSFWNMEVNHLGSYFGHPKSVSMEQIMKEIKSTMKTHLLDPIWDELVTESKRILASGSDETLGSQISPFFQLASTRKSLLNIFERDALRSGLMERFTLLLATPVTRSTDQALSYMNNLNKIHQSNKLLIMDYMSGDSAMLKAADQALRAHISTLGWGSNLAEYLARWIDRLLRGDVPSGASTSSSIRGSPKLRVVSSIPTIHSPELGTGLLQGVDTGNIKFILLILSQLEDRERFKTWYAWFLSRRLLSGKADREKEQTLLNQFQQIYGHGYVANLQRLISDNEASLNLNDKFSRRVKKPKVEPPEVIYRVFAKNAWPLTEDYRNFQWNPTLLASLQAFDFFYLEQHTGRVLTWNPEVTQVELSVTSSVNGSVTLVVLSAIQFAILEALIATNSILVKSLSSLVQVPTPSLSISLRKMQSSGLILIKNETISLNDAFTCSRAKINICPSIDSARSEVMESGKDTREDRSHVLQARIVAYMKWITTSTLSSLFHSLSIDNTLSLTDFDAVMKILVEKEYIKIENDSVTYIP